MMKHNITTVDEIYRHGLAHNVSLEPKSTNLLYIRVDIYIEYARGP
jgi:hypothetical protein